MSRSDNYSHQDQEIIDLGRKYISKCDKKAKEFYVSLRAQVSTSAILIDIEDARTLFRTMKIEGFKELKDVNYDSLLKKLENFSNRSEFGVCYFDGNRYELYGSLDFSKSTLRRVVVEKLVLRFRYDDLDHIYDKKLLEFLKSKIPKDRCVYLIGGDTMYIKDGELVVHSPFYSTKFKNISRDIDEIGYIGGTKIRWTLFTIGPFICNFCTYGLVVYNVKLKEEKLCGVEEIYRRYMMI